MLVIGITGSRHGLSEAQKRWFDNFVWASGEVHHGDCVGVDCEAATIIKRKGSWTIVSHPGDTPKWKADCSVNDIVLPEKKNLVRDRDIVDEVDFMLAFPGTMYEVKRSGTWYTIRYAKSKGKAMLIIYPDGSVVD